MPRPRVQLPAAAALAALLALAGAAFLPALDGPFQYDDARAILSNPRVRSPARLVEGTSPADLLGPGRPVTELVHGAVRAAAGDDPRAFHLASLLAHLLAAALVFLAARQVLGRVGHPRADPLAAVVAVLFAVHPLQTEAVCYASQLSEVLAAALGLLALLALVRADAAWPGAGPRHDLAASLGAAALLLLALGAKSVAAAIPAAFLLVAWGSGPVDRPRALRALRLAAPSLVVAVAAAARNLLSLGGAGDSAGLGAGVGPWRYLLTQARVHWLYLRLAAWPAGQSIDHAIAPSPGLDDLPTLAALVGLAALLAGAALLWRRAERLGPAAPGARAAALGLLWWFLLLAPTSSVVPIDDLAAEHRTYLPLAGLLLAAVVGLDAAISAGASGWSPRRRSAAVAALAAAAGVALWGATSARATTWRSDVALWQDAAAKAPGSARTGANHALALQQAGRGEEADAEYARALRLPDDPVRIAGVAMDYSAFLMERGDFGAALAVADLGVAAAPGRHEVRANRALSLAALGRLDEAVAEARRCVALAPLAPFPRYVLGASLRQQGRLDEARLAFGEALERGHDGGLAARPTFVALAALGRRDEGCLAWRALERSGEATPGLRRAASALGCDPSSR